VRVDARDLQGLLSIIRGVDYVVHSAAYVSVEESMERPELYMDSNVRSTLSVARACLKACVLVLYFSSAAVYGEPVKLSIPRTAL